MSRMSRWWTLVLVVALALAAGCAGSPEAKKARYLERGDRFFSQQQYREAIIEYRNVLQLDGANVHAFQQSGRAYYELGALGQAFPFLRQAKALEPNPLDVRLKLGTISLLGGKLEETQEKAAFKTLDTILKKNPSDVEGRFLRGRALLAKGQTGEAIAAFQRVLKQEPRLAEARLNLALANLQAGNVQQAKQELAEILKHSPQYSPASLRLAELSLQSGAPQAAIELLEPVATREPRNAPAPLLLGRAYLAAREAGKARG